MTTGAAGGIPRLRPVPLQELRLRDDALHWPVDQKLAELDSLTPVRGRIRVRHHGAVLEVEGEAETIVTLCCDHCLQHYNRRLQAAVHELLQLAGPDGAQLEGADLTALAASAAARGASGRRSRATGSRAGGSAAGAPASPATGRPPAAAGAGPGSPPRRRSRPGRPPEPLLIEALDDRLDPRGDFDPERWLFEQLSLQLPVVNRCGRDCPGPPLPAATAPAPAAAAGRANTAETPTDPRWAALRQFLP